MLKALGAMGPLLVLLHVTVPVFCTFFFCADEAVQSPSTFFFCWPVVLFNTRAWGMAATLGGNSIFSTLTTVYVSVRGIDQDALASNRFAEAGMVLGQGVSSLFWRVVTVATALG